MAFFLSLFFLSISSLEQADLVNVLCYLICNVKDLFLKFLHLYGLHPSTFFHISFSSGSGLCIFFFLSLLMLDISYTCGQSDPSIVSLCLNCRQGNDLENIKKNTILIYLLILKRITNAMTRQHEQNMINLNKYVFPS